MALSGARECANHGGASRRYHLGRTVAELDRKSRQQLGGRWRRYGDEAVLRARESVAHRQRRNQDLADAKLIESPCRADDIDDRIDGADFVKVNLVGRGVVNLGLGLGERFEYRDRAMFDRFRASDDLSIIARISPKWRSRLRLRHRRHRT